MVRPRTSSTAPSQMARLSFAMGEKCSPRWESSWPSSAMFMAWSEMRSKLVRLWSSMAEWRFSLSERPWEESFTR